MGVGPEERARLREAATGAWTATVEMDAALVLALLDALEAAEAKVERVEALWSLYDNWDGTRPHPGESSPHQRDQLRAALDGEGER